MSQGTATAALCWAYTSVSLHFGLQQRINSPGYKLSSHKELWSPCWKHFLFLDLAAFFRAGSRKARGDTDRLFCFRNVAETGENAAIKGIIQPTTAAGTHWKFMTFSKYLHQFQQFKPFKIDFFLIEQLKAYVAQRYHPRHTNIQILIPLSSKCEDCQSLTFMLIV